MSPIKEKPQLTEKPERKKAIKLSEAGVKVTREPDGNIEKSKINSAGSSKMKVRQVSAGDADSTAGGGEFKAVRKYAMALVAARSYTEKGLRDKLESKQTYTEEQIADAIEYVKSFGYVSDEKYARYAAMSLYRRGYGKMRIMMYLVSKGISHDVMDGVDFSEMDFNESALKAAEKNRGKSREKLIRTLKNYGFATSEIIYALENMKSEDDGE